MQSDEIADDATKVTEDAAGGDNDPHHSEKTADDSTKSHKMLPVLTKL